VPSTDEESVNEEDIGIEMPFEPVVKPNEGTEDDIVNQDGEQERQVGCKKHNPSKTSPPSTNMAPSTPAEGKCVNDAPTDDKPLADQKNDHKDNKSSKGKRMSFGFFARKIKKTASKKSIKERDKASFAAAPLLMEPKSIEKTKAPEITDNKGNFKSAQGQAVVAPLTPSEQVPLFNGPKSTEEVKSDPMMVDKSSGPEENSKLEQTEDTVDAVPTEIVIPLSTNPDTLVSQAELDTEEAFSVMSALLMESKHLPEVAKVFEAEHKVVALSRTQILEAAESGQQDLVERVPESQENTVNTSDYELAPSTTEDKQNTSTLDDDEEEGIEFSIIEFSITSIYKIQDENEDATVSAPPPPKPYEDKIEFNLSDKLETMKEAMPAEHSSLKSENDQGLKEVKTEAQLFKEPQTVSSCDALQKAIESGQAELTDLDFKVRNGTAEDITILVPSLYKEGANEVPAEAKGVEIPLSVADLELLQKLEADEQEKAKSLKQPEQDQEKRAETKDHANTIVSSHHSDEFLGMEPDTSFIAFQQYRSGTDIIKKDCLLVPSTLDDIPKRDDMPIQTTDKQSDDDEILRKEEESEAPVESSDDEILTGVEFTIASALKICEKSKDSEYHLTPTPQLSPPPTPTPSPPVPSPSSPTPTLQSKDRKSRTSFHLFPKRVEKSKKFKKKKENAIANTSKQPAVSLTSGPSKDETTPKATTQVDRESKAEDTMAKSKMQPKHAGQKQHPVSEESKSRDCSKSLLMQKTKVQARRPSRMIRLSAKRWFKSSKDKWTANTKIHLPETDGEDSATMSLEEGSFTTTTTTTGSGSEDEIEMEDGGKLVTTNTFLFAFDGGKLIERQRTEEITTIQLIGSDEEEVKAEWSTLRFDEEEPFEQIDNSLSAEEDKGKEEPEKLVYRILPSDFMDASFHHDAESQLSALADKVQDLGSCSGVEMKTGTICGQQLDNEIQISAFVDKVKDLGSCQGAEMKDAETKAEALLGDHLEKYGAYVDECSVMGKAQFDARGDKCMVVNKDNLMPCVDKCDTMGNDGLGACMDRCDALEPLVWGEIKSTRENEQHEDGMGMCWLDDDESNFDIYVSDDDNSIAASEEDSLFVSLEEIKLAEENAVQQGPSELDLLLRDLLPAI